MKCPNCGSSAQLKVVATKYIEDGWTIEVVRTYKCGCGQMFTGTSYHTCQECYEIVEKIKNRGLTKSPKSCYNTDTKERKEMK